MADIAASDVTYTKVEGSGAGSPSDPRSKQVTAVTFGDGSLEYPSGGIPLTKAELGCPTVIESCLVMGGAGILWVYDYANEKLRGYQTPAVNDTDPAAPLAELTGAISATALRLSTVGW